MNVDKIRKKVGKRIYMIDRMEKIIVQIWLELVAEYGLRNAEHPATNNWTQIIKTANSTSKGGNMWTNKSTPYPAP